jgi:endonuclease/exonuclease/phosphatase family metal-dependent hydrolase
MLRRLDADVLCLQEVNASRAGKRSPRRMAALAALLADTDYEGRPLVGTVDREGGGSMDVHNLAIVSRLPIEAHEQLRNDLVAPPAHRQSTALPAATEATALGWDRPLLHARLRLADGRALHVVNLHLRAPLAAPVAGQKLGPFAWKSTAGWAEGYFMAAVKRTGQALEARLLVDSIFDGEREPLLAVVGDFNAEAAEVPVRIVMGAEEDTGNGDLADRALVAVERSLPRSQRFTVLHHGAPQMLDHILVSRGLMADYRGVEIHNEALGDELVGYHGIERSPESFHAPVVARFAIAT